jgi:hypothetical protein
MKPQSGATRGLSTGIQDMAKTNYSFEKRQRELEKARKKQEKAQRKSATSPASHPQPPKQDGASHE